MKKYEKASMLARGAAARDFINEGLPKDLNITLKFYKKIGHGTNHNGKSKNILDSNLGGFF